MLTFLGNYFSSKERRMPRIGSDIVIRNGTIIDGTGATEFKCDIEINDGIIVAMGVNLPLSLIHI